MPAPAATARRDPALTADIDDCADDPCGDTESHSCTDTGTLSYDCTCADGTHTFAGGVTCSEIDEDCHDGGCDVVCAADLNLDGVVDVVRNRQPSPFHQHFNLSAVISVRNAGSLRFRHYLIIACCSLSNADLLVLLGFFGTTDGQVDIDGSGDGVCSVADLLQMLIYFGGRCDSRG